MNYTLNTVSVTTIGEPKQFNCSHKVGDGFVCDGENLIFFETTKQFSHYALCTLMPYIAAKQRASDPADWMKSETDISCPDPRCKAIFRFSVIDRVEHDYNPI